MNHSLIKRTVLATLVAGSLAALGALAPAADAAIDARLRVSVPGAEIAFRTTPRWVLVPGTPVYVVRDDMRPRQDFFRYRGWYYVYSHGTWYRSHRWNGRYVLVRERDLPRVFWQVPRNRWRAYPRHWRNGRDWHAERRWDRRDEWRDDRRDRRDERWDDRDDRDDYDRDGYRGTW